MSKKPIGKAHPLLVALLSFAGTALGAADRGFDYQPMACVPAGANAVPIAHVKSSAPVASARIYFRASEKDDFYYLELKSEPGQAFWAALPVPEEKTKAVEYRFWMKDVQGREIQTDTVTVVVTGRCQSTLTPEQREYSSNLVIGLTKHGQSAMPLGFLCTGVVSQITASGVLQPNYECLAMPLSVPNRLEKLLETDREVPTSEAFPARAGR